MVGKCTRIEKIEIENFKNVKYGQVVLKNSANLQSCGCRLAIFENEQNNKI